MFARRGAAEGSCDALAQTVDRIAWILSETHFAGAGASRSRKTLVDESLATALKRLRFSFDGAINRAFDTKNCLQLSVDLEQTAGCRYESDRQCLGGHGRARETAVAPSASVWA